MRLVFCHEQVGGKPVSAAAKSGLESSHDGTQTAQGKSHGDPHLVECFVPDGRSEAGALQRAGETSQVLLPLLEDLKRKGWDTSR